jgi:AcrR family transcriptional regulator
MDQPTSDPRQHQAATVQHLRERAAARVERTSLRGVAREIGMSPTGLKKFLLGTAPYSPTLRRLRKWYLHHAALPTGEVSYHDASAALVVLIHDLQPEPRRHAADCLLDCLERAYEDSGRPRPRWAADLRAEHGRRPQAK